MRQAALRVAGWGLGIAVVGLALIASPCQASEPAGTIKAASERSPTGARATSGDGRILLAQASKKTKAKSKRPMTAKADAAPAGGDASGPKFSKDVAPILVGNCIECHNPERRRGKFDLTTFQKLMAGSDSGPVIVAGNPQESALVLHIKGEADPKMPPGNNRPLAPEAIAKIEAWVKAGARLDAGLDPTASLRKIAPTPDDQRRAELAKLTPADRDKKLEATGLERWKKASPKTKPEITSGSHFLLFSNLPKERAQSTLKRLEGQVAQLKGFLGSAATALEPPEKISVYVFNEPGEFAEFSRGVERREVEQGDQAHANLAVDAPYLAAADPLAGHDDPNLKKQGSRKPSRSKRSSGSDEPGGSERNLSALLVEQLASACTAQASGGKAPQWLRLGLGAYFASQLDGRSAYFRHLRVQAAQEYKIGWQTKAQEALGGGDQTSTEKIRAIGFSLLEWLGSVHGQQLPVFVHGMLEGNEKLDEGINTLWGVDRQAFLIEWGDWLAARYGAAP